MGAWSQAFLVETVETGDKNHDMSQHHALFCRESLGKVNVKVVELSGMGQPMNSIA